MRVLVTGGAGYIGGHVVQALLAAGHEVVVLDDLSTGDAGRLPRQVDLITGAVGDRAAWRRALDGAPVDAVIHLAARKAVEESVARPLYYYEQNVTSWRTALEMIVEHAIPVVLLSSSAAVYGEAADGVVDESVTPRPQSPYGRSKLMAEWLLADTAAATGLRWAALRYFNVAGAAEPRLGDRSGTNLVPRLLSAASREEPCEIFGDGYPTPDGTCVRDYVHVVDIADAHVAALRGAADGAADDVYNIGTGRGVSVWEMVHAVRAVTGERLPARVLPPRAGDAASVVADASKIEDRLGWRADHRLQAIVASAWAAWRAPVSAESRASARPGSPTAAAR